MSNMYKETTASVETLLNEFKNGDKSVKETSIELENVYKSMYSQFGSRKVYAKFGISKTGKIMIDYKKHGNSINLSLSECQKLNNILSSRNFENYIRGQQEVIDERTNSFFAEKKTSNSRYNKQAVETTEQAEMSVTN